MHFGSNRNLKRQKQTTEQRKRVDTAHSKVSSTVLLHHVGSAQKAIHKSVAQQSSDWNLFAWLELNVSHWIKFKFEVWLELDCTHFDFAMKIVHQWAAWGWVEEYSIVTQREYSSDLSWVTICLIWNWVTEEINQLMNENCNAQRHWVIHSKAYIAFWNCRFQSESNSSSQRWSECQYKNIDQQIQQTWSEHSSHKLHLRRFECLQDVAPRKAS